MNHLFELLDRCAIAYERSDHAAVMTAAEAVREVPAMAGARAKNLFLWEPRSGRFTLVVVPFEKRIDLAALGRAMGTGRLSFASSAQLAEVLGIGPGAVSLLALVNDEDHRVTLVIDAAVWQAEGIQCHPLVNTATLSLDAVGLRRFLHETGHAPRVLDVPVRQEVPAQRTPPSE